MKLIPIFIAVLGSIAVVPSAIAEATEDQLEKYLRLNPSHCLRSTQAKIKQCLVDTYPPIRDSELNRIARNHLFGVYREAR